MIAPSPPPLPTPAIRRDHPDGRVTLAAVNEHWVIQLTIPMHDPATGERRTATVTLDKRTLWQTASGRAVRGVVVEWTEQKERRDPGRSNGDV